MPEEYALVKCYGCGNYVQVPWELLGDTRPEDIEGYICGACELDDDLWIDEQEHDAWWDDDDDE